MAMHQKDFNQSAIDAFMEDYEPLDYSPISADQRAFLREALKTFLIEIWWLRDLAPSDEFYAELRKLATLSEGNPELSAAVVRVQRRAVAVKAAMEQVGQALEIVREHCTMLSQQVVDARRRAVRAGWCTSGMGARAADHTSRSM